MKLAELTPKKRGEAGRKTVKGDGMLDLKPIVHAILKKYPLPRTAFTVYRIGPGCWKTGFVLPR